MAQLNDWLSIDKTSGTGNAEITLTASSYNELVERTQSLVIKGQKIKVYFGVKQLPFIETSSNTVFYTTVNGKKYDYDNDWYFSNMFKGENGAANIISHTYENGIGKVVFDTDITEMFGLVDDGWINKHPKERSTSVSQNNEVLLNIEQKKEIIPITFDGHTIRCGAEGGSITLEKWFEDTTDGVETTFNFSEINNSDTFIKLSPTIYKEGEDLTVTIEPSTVHLLETIILPNKLTNIGQGAFAGQYFLSSVTIPSSVTRIDDDAFSYCNNLREIRLGNNIEEIGSFCFENCKSLETMYLPQSIKNMGSYNFRGCENLKSVTLDFPMYNLPQETFYGCISLKTVSLPNTIENINSRAFFGCTSLEIFTLPDTVKYVGVGAFQKCTNLKNIQLSENITRIDDNAFSECNSLVSIKLPKTLLSVGKSSFSFCNSLESIELHNPLTTFVVGNGNYLDTFWRVKEGGTLYYPNNTSQPSILDGTEVDLGYYNWVGSATLPSFNYKDEFPNYIKYKTDDGNSAVILNKQFNDLYTVANYYDETDGYWYECYNKPLVTLNSMYMSLPSNVTDVVFPNTIETFDNVFGDSKVSEVIIPDSVKEIYIYALTSKNIKKVVFGNGVADLKLADYFGANINNIEELTIPEGVTGIYTGFPNSLKGLKKLSLPTTLKTIGEFVFYQLQSISVQEILSGLPNLEVIGESAFEDCKTDSYSITLPPTIKQIGKKALDVDGVYEYNIQGEITELNAFFGISKNYFCIRFSQNTPPTSNLPSDDSSYVTIFAPSDAKSVYDEWVTTLGSNWKCTVDIENPNYFWVEIENTNGNVNFSGTNSRIVYSFDKTDWLLLGENGVNMNGHNKVYFNNLVRNMYLSFDLTVSDYYSMGGNLNTLVDKNIATNFDCENLFKGDLLLKDASELELGLAEIPSKYCTAMFRGCTSLLKAPSINVTKVGANAFENMFRDCTSLVSIGSINADIVENKGCYYMFSDCTNLSTVPSITATSVGTDGFSYMFRNCRSITKSPAITVSEVGSYCFRSMFYGCASLVEASPIQIGKLSDHCCYYMFSNCTSLTTAPELPLTELAASCYYSMFSGCTSLTTAPILRADVLVDYCYAYMFNGCSNLNYIKMLATDVSAQSALNYWVQNVSSTGTFVKHPDAVIPSGNKGIPNGWTVETATE